MWFKRWKMDLDRKILKLRTGLVNTWEGRNVNTHAIQGRTSVREKEIHFRFNGWDIG